ncbi:MAG: FUSC family protein [Candidatus Deferrimicrobiaceae bacterium]
MNRFLPRLDATRVLIALKTCLAIVLCLAISLRLDWKPSFGAILIVVLQTPAQGASYKKGMLYIAGTLSGAIVGLALVALFAHDRFAFIVATALLTGFGIYRLQVSRYPYAWLIFTVTSMLVGFFSVQDVSSAFGIAVMRSSTICLAVVIAFLVHGIFWPIMAGKIFERQLHGFLDGCRGLLSLTSRALAGDEPDPDAMRKAETAQIKAIDALRGTLDAAAADTERFKRFHAGYQQLVDQLHDLLLTIFAVLEGMKSRPEDEAGKSVITGSDNIRSILETVEGEMEEIVRDLARPRDGTADPRESDARAVARIDQPGTIDTAFAAMLAGSVRDLARQVSKVRATVAGVEDPEQAPPPLPPPPRTPFRLTSGKLRKAAGSSLVILLLGWFFIQTQWPMGLQLSMVFATIVIALGALLPLIMIGRQLLLSLIIGAAIAAPLYLGIMPGINQYEQLIPWLCVALFPLFYLMTSPRPQRMIQALFSAIFVIALLSLDEESQSYSFSSFLNTWIGLSGGFASALAVFGLFSWVVPEREFWKQVRSFFAGCGQSMQDLAKSSPGTPSWTAIVKAGRQRWPGLLKQLQTWSSAINYKRVPGNDRHKTQALIESIEHLALRLASAEHVRQRSDEALEEPLRKLLGRFYDTCVESVQLIANSLADLKPIPDLPDTRSLVREIESRGDDLRRSAAGDNDILTSINSVMSVTAHMNLLADELNNCRDKVNALDWKGWNRNYF